MDVALARVKAVHANIKNAHAKRPQASSESSMHHTSGEAVPANVEMHVDHVATVAMEPLPHEIPEREKEMRETSKSVKHLEELRLAQEEVKKRLSIEESMLEYQRKL
ncbi:hypothetical protein ZWY2020_055792 [Hordeum vulgare]|nr:hypothetical protein ZWY2020_055792 [Hordeum vulgare]